MFFKEEELQALYRNGIMTKQDLRIYKKPPKSKMLKSLNKVLDDSEQLSDKEVIENIRVFLLSLNLSEKFVIFCIIKLLTEVNRRRRNV